MPSRYVLTPAFMAYLQVHRPQVHRDLVRNQLTECDLELSATNGRCSLVLAGLRDYSPRAFDRQVNSDAPCLVLDGHPDLLATSPRPANAIPVVALSTGERFYVDTCLLANLRGWPPEDFPERVVEAVVTDKVAYMLRVQVGPHEVPWDLDELRCCCRDLAWRLPAPVG